MNDSKTLSTQFVIGCFNILVILTLGALDVFSIRGSVYMVAAFLITWIALMDWDNN